MRGESASDVSREKNSNPTAGNHQLLRFKREGAKKKSKKRVAKRALFSSETCAVPVFFFGGISSSVGIAFALLFPLFIAG
tara:strand:- start:122 stop:361 length:240 start_codon:yes stop_codon:yes gene_type:complete